jgi:branched-chain amino acid transport system substrate-binding protein
MRSTANPDGDRGAAAFAAGDYAQAQEFFRKAIQGDRGNPELQIYLNNATARRSAKPPMTIAVVVPIESGLTSAEEILRGAADAQTEFNKAGGIDGRLLELVIANDDNDPKISPGVAQTLVAKPNILGVLGHNASAASEAAVGEYEKANMAMLSPTSATSLIKSKVFFRTNFSTEVQGATLANYARNVLKLNQVAVFYNPNDPTSRGLQESFVEHFREVGGGFVVAIDLANPDFDPKEQIQSLQGKFDTIALFTNTDLTTVAISLATANYALPAAQRMRLLGSNSLYKPQTLVSGQRAVEGLTIPVAWFAQTPYAQRAEERWGGQVSWRTATSYDGTKAFIEALSDQPSRASVLRNLTQVSLPADQTSGSPLRFSGERSRIGEPILVQVVSGKGGPTGSELVFRPLN